MTEKEKVKGENEKVEEKIEPEIELATCVRCCGEPGHGCCCGEE